MHMMILSCCRHVLLCCMQTPIHDVLQQKGHTKFLELAKVAGITEPASSALLTIFAPTNQVCEQWLGQCTSTVLIP